MDFRALGRAPSEFWAVSRRDCAEAHLTPKLRPKVFFTVCGVSDRLSDLVQYISPIRLTGII
jgi:hypothetical protein